MNTVVIVQARLTSTRLPGKVLKPIGQQPWPIPSIVHTYWRSTLAGFPVALAVPEGQWRDFVQAIHGHYGPTIRSEPGLNGQEIPILAGSEHDVLGRMAVVAMQYRADIVVRLTGDCPFVDPRMVWACADAARGFNCYVANCWPERTEPKGLDVEAFPMWALVDADLYATAPEEREHVTPWMHSNVKCVPMKAATNRPELRWVLDTQEDYDWFCKLATMIDCTPPHPTTRELLAFLNDHPEMERKDVA